MTEYTEIKKLDISSDVLLNNVGLTPILKP